MVLSKSLVNCHIRGVHSLVLCEKPMQRIFFTTPDHELRTPTSIAIHGHHCHIALTPLWGEIVNVGWFDAAYARYASENFTEFKYQSKINTGEGIFTPTGKSANLVYLDTKIRKTWYLHATDLHTVYTLSDRAAWLVTEGDEYTSYEPLCYAKEQPKITPDLYQPMTLEFLLKEFHA